ncbi:MAG: MdtA/MuxA family multidrug efflux RND transporter periplasmic adaptor subunit [Thermodesulfovibrionales bacterium]
MEDMNPQEEKGMSGRSDSHKHHNKHWWIGIAVICILAAGGYFFVARQQKPSLPAGQKSAGAQALPVIAEAAKKGDIGVYINGLGSVVPVNTVIVRSRVDGQLMKILFKEGQSVNTGDLLAEIDPRPFEVQLRQAEGQMARDQALLKNARLDLERYRLLSAQDSIAKQQVDTQEALALQYEGAVKTDQGQIDSAKLQLIYSRITAPASGRVGLRLVDPGNIVRATDTGGIVVITQLQPISVLFPIPEDSLPAVLRKHNAHETLVVDAYDREQKQKLATGTLQTIDNQIDPTTGTVKLKAAFQNKGNELFPSQFVNARLLVEMKKDAILVPSSAIQRGQRGTFVYMVKSDNTVDSRVVTLGVIQGDQTSITEGLDAGDVVVVDGAERLKDGSRVEIKEQEKKQEKRGANPKRQPK